MSFAEDERGWDEDEDWPGDWPDDLPDNGPDDRPWSLLPDEWEPL